MSPVAGIRLATEGGYKRTLPKTSHLMDFVSVYRNCVGPVAGSLFAEHSIRFKHTVFIRLAKIPSLINANHSDESSGTRGLFQLKFE
jgi:hypothetical protein